MFAYSLQLYVYSLYALCCITPTKFYNEDKQKSTLRET